MSHASEFDDFSQVLPPQNLEAFSRAVNPPPDGLSPAELIRLDLEHAKRIFARDEEALTKHSYVAEPEYEWFPEAIRISGREAVRAVAARGPVLGDKSRGVAEQEIRSVSFGHNLLVVEWRRPFPLPDGTTRWGHGIHVIPYENGRITGERLYVDSFVASLRSRNEEELLRIPGVTRL